jgi:hypothetical protein
LQASGFTGVEKVIRRRTFAAKPNLSRPKERLCALYRFDK